jgi:hypothetical protein
VRPPKLLHHRTKSKIQKITDTEGEGATAEEEATTEESLGEGMQAMKKVTIKEEEGVVVVT